MLRMGKLTDYGIVLMSYFAAHQSQRFSAQALTNAVKVPLPTVRKVLKFLSQAGLLDSERGVAGGYRLSRLPEAISVAEIVTAIEGPIELTECVSDESRCDQATHCAIQTNWSRINQAVFHALDEVKLANMVAPSYNQDTSPIAFYPSFNKMANVKVDGEANE